ncbi:MAG: hypothetical protein U9Q74_11430 [Gemmatimonadota bacterium]|nr:hypothetical protein [Gemmatimonadota bacterium]
MARRLRELFGPDAGNDLVTWMDETAAVRADVGDLRREMRADITELRHEMRVGFARMEAAVAALAGVLKAGQAAFVAHGGDNGLGVFGHAAHVGDNGLGWCYITQEQRMTQVRGHPLESSRGSCLMLPLR